MDYYQYIEKVLQKNINKNGGTMKITDIIEKKRDKKELNKEEIKYFISKYCNGEITDYQASALIMAIYLNGMTDQETTDLTLEMAYSGEVLDLSKISNNIVDKHSTGGVGDKVSLILLPLVSSLGVPVAKMSGRGLGFTGGTIDKLESIKGYNTNIDIHKFAENVENIGISLISQTLNLAPADKKIYALRDSISCVESIPLIASSIMSKKIASGAQKIVLDVTVGKGAFMQDIQKAKELAKKMIAIGNLANREVVCILTNMNEPLGYAVGNSLEVVEAIEFLKGNMPKDLKSVVLELGAYMIKLAGEGNDIQLNKEKLLENIKNKKGLEKFKELVKNQEGDISYVENTEKFEKAKYIENIYSESDGHIQEINAKEIGKISGELGAGRITKEEQIDYAVGIILNKKMGDKIKSKEIIAQIYANDQERLENAKAKIKEIIKISKEYKEKEKSILEIIL